MSSADHFPMRLELKGKTDREYFGVGPEVQEIEFLCNLIYDQSQVQEGVRQCHVGNNDYIVTNIKVVA